MQLNLSNDRIWRWLVLAAAVYFLVRGPWRAIHNSADLLTVFAAARCWVHGMNPYAPGDLVVSARAGGAEVSEAYFLVTPSVYFPPALLLLSPLAALPWTVAKAIWLFCSLGASLWVMVALARMAKGWTVAVWSFLLAFSPLHSGIAEGQPSVLVCCLIAISIVTPQPYVAGLLLGIALCIKPQLAFGFLFLAIALRQGRKLIAACTTGLVLSAAALMWMKPGSLTTLISNLSAVSSASGMDSGSALNPRRFTLINVDTLIPQALYSIPVMAIVYAIIASVSAIAVVRAARAGDTRMAVAVVASATVLVGYHRFYDAQILWLGIPAMLLVVQGRMSLVLRAGYGVFLIPGQTMAALWLNARGDGPWSFLLLHHQTLACVMIWLIFAVTAIKLGEGQHERGLASATDSSIT
jgi:hypothetical protein